MPGDDVTSRSRGSAWGDLRSRSVWRWQLILAASTVAVVATYVLLNPALFGDPRFFSGSVGIAVITAATLVVPWHLFSKAAIAIVPLLDIIGVGLMSVGGETRASLLWVFPVSWIATYYRIPWLITGLGLIAVILVIDTFNGGATPELAQRALILLLCLGFMGVTINVGSRRTVAYGTLLRRQFAQLDRTRMRAENQARRIATLADSLDTGLARFDRDGVIFDANRAFLELYGAASMAEFSPTAAVEYDTFRGKALPPERTFIERAIAGDRFDHHRVWIYSARAQWRALNVSTRPVQEDAGDRPTNLVIVNDVTDAVNAERDRKTVSSVVSHELRNPLTAIAGHTDLLLERDDLPHDVQRQLAVIDNASQRMQRLITSALDGIGGRAPEAERVDLREIVSASIVAFSPAASTAQVILTMDLQIGQHVTGDAFELRQAFDNILGNAIKYTTHGGSVHVTLRSSADGTDEITLSVTDSGIGMSEQDRLRMFERGYRANAARTAGIPGSGIGMALVADIVARHGGRLGVESTLGRGTTVAIILPHETDASQGEAGEVPV